MARHAAALRQQVCRRIERAADDDGVCRLVQRHDLRQRRATEGQRREVVGDQMAVEGVADVREDQRTQAERFHQLAQVLEVAGRQ